MGLFSGIGKALAKGRENRKARRTERKAGRKQKRDDRRAFKLAKIHARQDARSERTRMRQDSKTARASFQAEADKVAYENGAEPIEHQSMGMQIGGKVLGAVSSIFGGGGGSDGSGDGGEGGYGGEGEGYDGSGERSGSGSRSGSKPDNKKMLIIGGLALAALLIIPKMLKKQRR